MAAMNIGSIVELVQNSIDNIPSTVDSGNNIRDWVRIGIVRFQNYSGQGIDETSITQTFQAVLFDYGRMMVLSKMLGVGVDFSASLGEFSVDKSSGGADKSQLTDVLTLINQEMKSIGRDMPFQMVRG